MIYCYIYEGMADFEITLLLHRLKNTGKRECIFISENILPIKAQSGLTYIPDKKIDEINASEETSIFSTSDFEALIIPGGPINNEQNSICSLVQEAVKYNKLVAAICFGPQFLGRAGILQEYRFTTSCSEEKIRQLGVIDPFNWKNYLHQRTVVDRNIITAQGFAFVDFAVEVCKYLNVFESEHQLEQQLLRVKTDRME